MLVHSMVGHGVWVTTTSSQGRRQGIDLLLQFGDPAVGLFLPFAIRRSDDALSSSLCTAFAGRTVVIYLTLDLELAACFAGSGPFQVVGI